MYHIYYISADGHQLDLTNPDRKYIFLKEDGINGLVGQTTDISTKVSLRTGQHFNGLNIEAMTGSLSIVLLEGENEKTLKEISEEVRNAFSRTRPGQLIISDDEGFGEQYCTVRLSENISALPRDPSEGYAGNSLEVEIPLIADEGVWRRKRQSRDNETTVDIINDGDAITYPVIKWGQGVTGKVTLPSGVKFSLPAVSEDRYIHLDNSKSLKVTNKDGVIDRELWAQLTDKAVAEGIPIYKKRTFSIPRGARLFWDILVLDPWR